MKRFSGFFAALLLAATTSTLSAQQSIYMTADPIKGDQTGVHAGEFKVGSFTSSATNPVSISTTVVAGKASFAPVKVSMQMPLVAGASFYKSLAMGTLFPSIEIRLYNATGRIFYKTVYENAALTKVQTDGADENVQQLEFVYARMRSFSSPDATGATPPAQVGCWDAVMNRIC